MWTVKVKRLGLYIESGRMSDYMSVQDIFNMYFKEDSEAEIIVKEHEFTNYDEAMNVFNTYRDVAASMYSEADNTLYLQFIVITEVDQDEQFYYESTVNSYFGDLFNAA